MILFESIKSIVEVSKISERRRNHDLRDAMHIATSIRYGYSGLITGDDRLLKLDQKFSQIFGFRIFKIADAVSFANQLIQKQLKLEELNKSLN